MSKWVIVGAIVLILLQLGNLASAGSVLRIVGYEVIDKGNNLIAFGNRSTFSDCNDLNKFTMYGNITPGDIFFLNLTLKNTGDYATNGGGITYNRLYDQYGISRLREVMDNFTLLNPPESKTLQPPPTGEPVTFQYKMNTSKYLAPGNYSPEFTTTGAAYTEQCQVKIPVGSAGSAGYNYFQITPLYFDINNFNYKSAYDDKAGMNKVWFGNWTLNITATLKNFGYESAGNAKSFTFSGLICHQTQINESANSFDVPCFASDSAGNKNWGGVQSLNYGETKNFSCLFNATNSSYYKLNECDLNGNGYIWCDISIEGLNGPADAPNWNYKVLSDGFTHKLNFNLGRHCIDAVEPPYSWTFRSTVPDPVNVFIVPGLAFNYTTNITNYKYYDPIYYSKNISLTKNINVTWAIYDSSLNLVSLNTREVLPFDVAGTTITKLGRSLTGNYYPWDIPQKPQLSELQMFLQSYIPIGKEGAFFAMSVLPSTGLETDALGSTPKQTAMGIWDLDAQQCDCQTSALSPLPPCNRGPTGDGPKRVNASTAICTAGFGGPTKWKHINLTRLIYIDGENDTIVRYVAPNTIFTFGVEVKNPLSNSTNYSITYKALQATHPQPVITFNPNIIELKAAGNNAPASSLGTLTVYVPDGVRPGSIFKYLVNVTSVEFPFMYDNIHIILIVSAHDVEVVAINKTPNQFVYDPDQLSTVQIKAIIRNNFDFEENVTLNMTTIDSTGYGLDFIACGGQNITLSGMETKIIDCGAYVDISGYDYENIAVRADLGLLTGTDTSPKNNHKMEIISVIRNRREPITIPDTNIFVFMALLISFLAFRRKVLKK